MTNKISQKRIVAICVLILMIFATLAFIYTRSAKSEKDSANESAAVSGTVKPIVDPEDKIPEETFIHYLRKAAHFSEFALLGAQIMILCIVITGKTGWKNSALCISAALIFALIDETVQIFSERGSLVSDIWIDLSGSLLSILLTVSVYELIVLPTIKKHRTKQIQTNDRTNN